MGTKKLFHALGGAISLLVLTLLSLSSVRHVSLAQGGDIEMVKILNHAGNVVRVGEVLTFTIALTNNSTFTLTNVTVVDNYDNTTLAFAGATPIQSSHDPGAAEIIWDNVAAPPIPPGQGVAITVTFVAEHPKPAVVNAAMAQDLRYEGGALTQTAETSRTQEAVGGAAPVVKSLSPPGSTPPAGLPVTFTHIITNDGAAIMTRLPLTDTYDPAFLEFNFAVPTPSITSPPGLLVWPDLTTYFGPIPADTAVVVTTVFTALTRVVGTVNQASTAGALDQFNNILTAGSARVPITIIDDTPAPAPATGDENDDDDENEAALPAPTSAPVAPTAAPLAEQFAPAAPRYLPETGQLQTGDWPALLIGCGLLTTGGYILKMKRSNNKR
ncbi:MAG: hypothetical protein AB1801_06305 [Chloroflexota bacterium]